MSEKDFLYQRRYRGRLRGAVFDWAGTTVDHGCCAPAVTFVEVFRRRGVELGLEEARGPMGQHKKVHIRQLTQLPEVARRWRDAHGRDCTESDVDAMFDDFVPLQLDCLADYAEPVPGCLETAAELRRRGLRIGSTTGYTGEMMDVLCPEAKRRGYEPDATVSVTDVPAGRPEPWMCLLAAQRLGVYPMEALVKVGDTVPDVLEGLNAGMWTVAVARTGNEMGLALAALEALAPEERERRLSRAYERLHRAGAHYVVDSIADLLPCLDDIDRRLARGERP